MPAFLRWCVVVLGGAMVGGGLVLHGYVAFAHHVRQQVDNTFFLWRAIGQATFAFQDGENRLGLTMREVPEGVLDEGTRAAWVLLIIGTLVAVTGPLIPRGKAAPARKRA